MYIYSKKKYPFLFNKKEKKVNKKNMFIIMKSVKKKKKKKKKIGIYLILGRIRSRIKMKRIRNTASLYSTIWIWLSLKNIFWFDCPFYLETILGVHQFCFRLGFLKVSRTRSLICPITSTDARFEVPSSPPMTKRKPLMVMTPALRRA